MNWLTKWITDEWRNAWKWLNVQAAAVLVAAPILYTQLESLQAYIPPKWFRYGMASVGLLVLINTLRKKKADSPPPGPTQ
jgi:uncharacterized membrane protein YfcA